MAIGTHKKMIRPFDIILITFFLIASVIPVGFFAWQQSRLPEDVSLIAVVTINGVEVDRFELNEDAQYLVTYTTDHGLIGDQYNIVEVAGSQIRVQRDNSPDQVGVNMGWISHAGETIVVLPHRFLIQIEAEHLSDYEDEIIIPF